MNRRKLVSTLLALNPVSKRNSLETKKAVQVRRKRDRARNNPPSKGSTSLLEVVEENQADRADSLVNEDDLEDQQQSSAKSRLLQIVVAERREALATSEKRQIVNDSVEVIEKIEVETVHIKDAKHQPAQHGSLFQRGSSLMSNVRSSIKRAVSGIKTGSSSKKVDDEKTTRELLACHESQDSGLGEDSDLEHSSSQRQPNHTGSSSAATTPRSPTPGMTLHTQQPLSSSLRKSSSSGLVAAAAATAAKHVLIREPSLSALPSARRRRHIRRETARIYARVTPKAGLGFADSVSSQWQVILDSAREEVEVLVACDQCVLRHLLFCADEERVRRAIGGIDTAEDASVVLLNVYRVLFFDWVSVKSGSVVLHCVQRFLIIVVDSVSDLDMEERLHFAGLFRAVLRSGELDRYRNLRSSLEDTRRAYVDFWVALLCAPFSRATSPDAQAISHRLYRKIGAVNVNTKSGD